MANDRNANAMRVLGKVSVKSALIKGKALRYAGDTATLAELPTTQGGNRSSSVAPDLVADDDGDGITVRGGVAGGGEEREHTQKQYRASGK
jgi:hypothetical protein